MEASRIVRDVSAGRLRALAPLLTIGIAVIIAAAFIALSGRDPLATFRAIFNGSGLNWLLPWESASARASAAFNLQQTLLVVAPLIVLGLAVALPFHAGLFNIGGQGQYVLGAVAAAWIGSSFSGMPSWAHVLLAMAGAALAGGAFAALAGTLKAAWGANEVITTIMLDYVAVWIGSYVFSVGGPLHDLSQPTLPISRTVVPGARLPVFWGDPLLQGAHIGVFIAVAALVLTGVVLTRTSVGYEIRAVGANPDAARYGGINVDMTIVKTMAAAGVLAGIGGAFDVLGWEFHITATDIPASQIGFAGVAVALLGRNKPVGVLLASVLFGALLTGTTDRNLDPSVFPPNLAGSLATVIQGVVLFAVCINLLALRRPASVLNLAARLRIRSPAASRKGPL